MEPSGHDLVTSDAATFAQALREVDNDNEVIVMPKDVTGPRLTAQAHSEASGHVVIARPDLPGPSRAQLGRGAPPRSPGLANAVTRSLARFDLEPYRVSQYSLSLRIPDAVLEPAIAALLRLPVVDYVEANQTILVTPSSAPVNSVDALIALADPQGANPADVKHTFHNVQGAWEITRGAGAKVGIMDSGLAFSNAPGSPQQHPDAQLLSSTSGVLALGFADDYNSDDNSNFPDCGASAQQSGSCVPWDDHSASVFQAAHGSAMVGIVGANDNNEGTVGLMPDGLTVSMKIFQNCSLSGKYFCSGNTYALETDDWVAAIDWASANNLDVLSMSFGSSSVPSAVYDALGRAYYFHDILLIAPVPNEGENGSTKLVEVPHVMGVGGVSTGRANLDNSDLDDRQEVSALASRSPTIGVACTSPSSFCGLNSSKQTNGTSQATAIVVAIAGLVRADEPNIAVDDLRTRLSRTAENGTLRIVNARNAVLDVVSPQPPEPIRVSIDGPDYILTSGMKTWTANATGGNAPNGQQSYTYLWEREDYLGGPRYSVASSRTYSDFVSTSQPGFVLYVTVSDGSDSGIAARSVQGNNSGVDCPPNTLC